MTLLRARRRSFFLLAAVLAAVVIEAGAAGTTALLVARGWMAEIPRLTSRELATYFDQHDTSLGWPGPQPAVANACVSVFGDSFTAGPSDTGESYPDQLAKRLGCGVRNYGVGGYGSDQALMLSEAVVASDDAPVAILAHVSENILRNVNQYRNLLYPHQELMFKPRFVVSGGRLIRVPLPIANAADINTFVDDPDRLLTNDFFVTRPRRRFPYTLAIAQWMWSDFHFRAWVEGVPRHEPFYRVNHPSRALEVTEKIIEEFVDDMTGRRRTAFVLLIPVGDDFAYVKRTSRWPDQPLAEYLASKDIAVIHAGRAMLERLGSRDHCELFEDCNGHYNASGYRMLAEIVADAIRQSLTVQHAGNMRGAFAATDNMSESGRLREVGGTIDGR